MQIRDRIRELRRVPAKSLIANPLNWRRHPENQTAAMRAMLDEVGWAGAVVAYEHGDELRLIDGHLRAEIAPDEEVPVLVLDVTEYEAKKLLATFDPVGAGAEANKAALAALLSEIEIEADEITALLDDLDLTETLDVPEEFPEVDESIEIEHRCPKCGYEFSGGKSSPVEGTGERRKTDASDL